MEYGKEPRSAADSVQSPLEGDSVQSPLEGDKGIVLKATWNEQHNAAPGNCLPGAAACPAGHRRNRQQLILFASAKEMCSFLPAGRVGYKTKGAVAVCR